MQLKDEIGQVPGGVPKRERDELFHDAVDHDETVLRVPADHLSTGRDGGHYGVVRGAT